MKPRVEGAFTIYSVSLKLNNRESGRILVVQRRKQPFQVFRPPIPEDLKAEDWTVWQRPDYLDDSVEDWRLLQESEKHERSTTLPADCFELRYQIEKLALEKWTPPKK